MVIIKTIPKCTDSKGNIIKIGKEIGKRGRRYCL